ncbi:hypothetical protein [Vibrio rotiferianus]|uniref:hypothetical protein n=1 Tax=Vibrio rotiferianus TaxID=190895 RepID=UPI0005EE3A59|nr:hypothetical protein [Vibrio rotiferianus]
MKAKKDGIEFHLEKLFVERGSFFEIHQFKSGKLSKDFIRSKEELDWFFMHTDLYSYEWVKFYLANGSICFMFSNVMLQDEYDKSCCDWEYLTKMSYFYANLDYHGLAYYIQLNGRHFGHFASEAVRCILKESPILRKKLGALSYIFSR